MLEVMRTLKTAIVAVGVVALLKMPNARGTEIDTFALSPARTALIAPVKNPVAMRRCVAII
jgi:hypothetical protein